MDLQQKQTYVGEAVDYNASFHKLMRMFTLSVLISFLGTALGSTLPVAIFLPLIIVELVMMVSAFFIQRRGKAIGYGFVYAFCLISGITIYPVVANYAGQFGAQMVMQAFILTGAMFAGLSLYGYYSKRDFSFLRGFLMVGLIALIGVGIIQMFAGGFGGPLGLVISFAGIMIFSGFILYDISNYRHGLEDKMIPLAVLSLYLSFVNLFLYVLRFLGILQDD
ncbi:MAG: Bax inhibitor-1/YccA family protein [Paenibacillaceae bacterium]